MIISEHWYALRQPGSSAPGGGCAVARYLPEAHRSSQPSRISNDPARAIPPACAIMPLQTCPTARTRQDGTNHAVPDLPQGRYDRQQCQPLQPQDQNPLEGQCPQADPGHQRQAHPRQNLLPLPADDVQAPPGTQIPDADRRLIHPAGRSNQPV